MTILLQLAYIYFGENILKAEGTLSEYKRKLVIVVSDRCPL